MVNKPRMGSMAHGNLAFKCALFNFRIVDTIASDVMVFEAALVISRVAHVTYMEREIGRWTVKQTEKSDRKLN